MKSKFDFRKYLVYIVAAVIFVAMTLVYCAPALNGKKVSAGDNVSARSAVHESVQYHKDTGDYTWWTGSMFSGMPNYQIGGGHSSSEMLLRPFNAILHKGYDSAVWAVLLYFFCFFVLMRAFEVEKKTAIVGAIATALSSYFFVIIAAGHNTKTAAIALVSVVLAGMQYTFRGKYAPGFILSALFTAVGFSVHPQMAYYLFMMMGVLWLARLVEAIREKKLKPFGISTGIFVAAVLIGFGCGSANTMANSEYVRETMRGGHSDLAKTEAKAPAKGLDIDYATQWSYGIDESLSFLIPGFKGGANSVDVGADSQLCRDMVRKGVPRKQAAEFCSGAPMYWGDQPFTAGNVYAGAIVCFLFVLGLFIVKGPVKWALLISTLFSFALAWGSNFMPLTEFFFKYFPLYSKFRAVSSILIVAEIAMPLLGFMAVKQVLEDREKTVKPLLISAAITGGICLVFALFGASIYDFTAASDAQWAASLDWLYPSILGQRAEILRSDSWRSFLFIALAALVLWLYARNFLSNIKPGVREAALAAILGVLVVADMWPVDKRYFNDSNFVSAKQDAGVFAMQPWEKAIADDTDPNFRVMNLTVNTFNDARTSYYYKSVGGYSAAKLRRYQDLIDRHLGRGNMEVVNMLNTKYLIVKGDDGQPKPVYNPDAFGNAWFVGKVHEAGSADEECRALSKIDLRSEAVCSSDFFAGLSNPAPGIAPDAEVELTSYAPNRLEYKSRSSRPGVIVFSEIYYPHGWKASIDGAPAGHFRADYTLRALEVPAGEHSISFVFEPDSIRRGNVLATVCIILMYVLSALAIAIQLKRR